MRSTLAAAFLLVVASPSPLAQSRDWPTYMHDNTRAGSTPGRLPRLLAERWVVASPVPPERAWPGPGGKVIERLHLLHRVRFDEVFHVAIARGRVFFGSSVDHCVRALDLTSGVEKWRFVTGGPVRLAPTVWQGRVFFGSDDGIAYCLDRDSGRLVWQIRAGPRDERILARGRMSSRWPVRTGVLIDDGIAYFGAGTFPHENVFVYAVHAKTGRVLWCNDAISQRQAGRNDLTPQGYLLASQAHVYVPSGRTLPAAIDKATGRLVHKQRRGGKQVGGSQALLADDKILTVGEHHILALDQTRGDIVGKLRGHQMTLAGQRAYIATGDQLIAVDRLRYLNANRQGHPQAKAAAKLRKELREHPFLAARKARAKQKTDQERRRLDGLIARHRRDYEAKKKELATLVGIRWRVPCGHESALILAGETLVVGGKNQVVAYSAKNGGRLWGTRVEGDARGLAVADGHLVVSTSTGRIYCYGTATRRATGEPAVADRAAAPFPADESGEACGAQAEEILALTGVRRGYCLVLGAGRLAYELARRSELRITCVESDASKVRAAREALLGTGLYGWRIAVDHVDLGVLPYPSYFANLVVCEPSSGRRFGGAKVARLVKPHGGALCLALPAGAPAGAGRPLDAWLTATGLDEEGATRRTRGGWTVLRRGALPGAAPWTHQYGNSGATACIDDMRVKGGLSVLWYGDPGPSKMLNRHVGSVGPISVGGRLFLQGDKTISAWDAYNGLFLWERENPGALRTGVFRNYEPGNLAADAESLFVVHGRCCERFAAATGKLRRTYEIPDSDAQRGHGWGYVATQDGILFGTSTRRQLLPEEKRGRGQPYARASSTTVFARDVATGRLLWTHQGRSIQHTAVAIDGGRVFFVDSSLTPELREEFLQQDKSKLQKLQGKARELAEKELKRIDVRLAVALDARTGEKYWARPVDVTDCTKVGIGHGRLTLMAADGHVVLCGANANGHYWKQFLSGEFLRRRLVVLAADDGRQIWARDANYRHRPIIVGKDVIAEPWAYDLETGEQRMRIHPLTGRLTPWMFPRPGHHCGMVTATPSMMLFRSMFTAYYDLQADSGTRHFAGHRLGCWVNAIPAGGLVLVPEASAGCACLFSLTSTIVFEPRPGRQVWGVYGAVGPKTPVRHMALNLGGPGDRRDRHGKLWLAYPRPASRRGIDLSLNLKHELAAGGGFYQRNDASYEVAGAEVPWLFASGVLGLERVQLPLLAAEQKPATYTVRLYFAAEPADRPGKRAFGVKLQGKAVLGRFDVRSRAGAARRALVREFRKVPVKETLTIELVPADRKPSPAGLPRLNAIEVLRTAADEIRKKSD